jgi:hypothetical protein
MISPILFISTIFIRYINKGNPIICFPLSLFNNFIATKSKMSNITYAAAASVGVASTQRDFIRVDLTDFEHRRDEIIETVMKASTTQGFFYGKYMGK